jgi:hypothetical protein
MSSEDKKAGWLDFKEVKASANIGSVIRGLNLQETIKNKEDEWIGFCPFHPGKGKADSFHISESKKGYHCFCCKRKGSLIDFVKEYKLLLGEEAIGLREAASLIEFWTQQEQFKAIKNVRAEQERHDLGEMDAMAIVKDMDAADVTAALHVPNVDGLALLVDFAEACRLVTFGRAHVTDFVAVRVDVLMALVSQLSPRMQAEAIDAKPTENGKT